MERAGLGDGSFLTPGVVSMLPRFLSDTIWNVGIFDVLPNARLHPGMDCGPAATKGLAMAEVCNLSQSREHPSANPNKRL